MQGLFWPLTAVLAFGAGLAVAGLVRPTPSAAPEVSRLQSVVTRLETQVTTLQARLRARETSAAGQRRSSTATAAAADRMQEVETALADRYAAAALDSGRRDRDTRTGRSDAADAASQGAARARQSAAAATLEVALDRFYAYLDDAIAGGAPRWRMRELIADLKAMGDAGAGALMRVLTDGTTTGERRMAAQLLGELQAASALPVFRDLLQNESDVLLRRSTSNALRRLQTPDSVPLMESLLANTSEDRIVRTNAAYGLAQLGRQEGVTGLMQIFEESGPDSRGRDAALRALTTTGDERSLPFMRQLATSSADATYRLSAIRFLSSQSDRQALPALQQMMQSPVEQPSVRDAAAQAYRTISAKR